MCFAYLKALTSRSQSERSASSKSLEEENVGVNAELWTETPDSASSTFYVDWSVDTPSETHRSKSQDYEPIGSAVSSAYLPVGFIPDSRNISECHFICFK